MSIPMALSNAHQHDTQSGDLMNEEVGRSSRPPSFSISAGSPFPPSGEDNGCTVQLKHDPDSEECPHCKSFRELGSPLGNESQSCPDCDKKAETIQRTIPPSDSDDPERSRAREKLVRAQDLLQSLQVELRYMLREERENTQEIAQLVSDANALRLAIAEIVDVLENGSDRDQALASVGGMLAVGAAVPVPEEVVTWPVAGIAALGILIFMSSTSDLLEDAVDDLSDAIDQVTTRRRPRCRIFPLGYHRGGDANHNAIADSAPPNVHPGSDIEVVGPAGRKSFDALDPSGALWEVKTLNYSTYAPFLQPIVITQMVMEMVTELAVAAACGRRYVFGVTDPQLFQELLPVTPPGVQLRQI